MVLLNKCDLIEAADPLPGSAYKAEDRKAGKSAWVALHGKTGRRHVELLAEFTGYEKTYEMVELGNA